MDAACLDEARALAFAGGELGETERATVESHIDECGTCRQVLTALIKRETRGRSITRRSAAEQGPSTPWPEGPPARGPGEWAPGTRIARYVVRERIGRGGMGAVWRAEDLELGRPVALKRLHAGADRDDRARLLREARAAAQLQHPNVVAVYEVGEAQGEPFLAMELVDGETLAAWLKKPRELRPILAVLAQAGRGLAAAHERGLVHRDFKPDNVLIDKLGRARVADFGLARAGGAPGTVARADGVLAQVTETGTISGTPAYLAPELVEGAPPDARSDQYAFAITCFEALHGHHPFAGTTAEVLWTEMAAGRVRDGKGDIPARLDRVVRRGLAVDPAERWPSVAAFVEALEHRPRRRWPWVAGLAAVIAANAAVFALWNSPAADSCERGSHLVDSVWNAGVRDELAHQLAAAAPHREGAIATAGKLADDWASAWRLGHESACHAEPAQRATRLACLDADLGELRAQLAAWDAPDAGLADRVVAAIAGLPRPESCAEHAPVASHAPQELQDRIAALAALVRSGKFRAAKPLLPSLISAAEASGDATILHKAFSAAGQIEGEAGDRQRALAYDARAAREAARAGDDAATLDALMREAEVTISESRPLDALGLIDAADALDARTGLHFADRLAVARADALAALGRAPEAIAAYQHAIALLEPRAPRDRLARLELAAAYGALGSAYGLQERREEAEAALQHGLQIEEAEYGPDHPEVARTLHDLGLQDLNLGHVDDAVSHFKRAREIFAAAYGPKQREVAACDLALADVAMTSDRCRDAVAEYERAGAEANGDDTILAAVESGLGQCAAGDDDNRAAAEHYSRALAIYARIGKTGIDVGDLEVELGMARAQLGDDAAAREQIKLAMAQYDGAGADDIARIDGWRLLAEIEHRAGHDARAIELDKKAVTALGDSPRADFQRARQDAEQQIAAWSKR